MRHVPDRIKDKCEACQPEEFCPRGPIVDMKLEYDRIDSIVVFP